MTAAAHAEGGAVPAQLAHCGFFNRNKPRSIPRPKGPSAGVNQNGLFSGIPFAGAMAAQDIANRPWRSEASDSRPAGPA